MKKVSTFVKLVGFVLLMTICVHSTLNAQTPADQPGIAAGPGETAYNGDGGPIVPFDGGMNLLLAATGIAFASMNYKKQAFAFVKK